MFEQHVEKYMYQHLQILVFILSNQDFTLFLLDHPILHTNHFLNREVYIYLRHVQ